MADPKPVVTAIDTLLQDHTDAEIADILNQRGLTSGKGLPFHRLLVRDIRQDYQLTSRFDRLRDRGLLTAHELAELLDVRGRSLSEPRVRIPLVRHEIAAVAEASTHC